MEDKDICKCGLASIVYTPIAEDEYYAEAVNSMINKNRYSHSVICRTCGHEFSEYDYCMVTVEYI